MCGRSVKLFALALALSTVGMATSIKDKETLNRISKYRDWSRLTQRPFQIDLSSIAG
jgi:hypothetical protein